MGPSPAGAANWRQELESNLTKARCVVVVWSERSVSKDGEFVHDEASRVLDRLVPVHIDRVRPPLGFGERQSLDLVGWKGTPKDARFTDVVAAVRAMLDGERPPAPKWPTIRRLRIGGVSTIASFASFALAVMLNLGSLQNFVCRLSFVRGVCGEHGWGGVPSRAEQSAFDAALTVEDDSGWRGFLSKFPNGPLAEETQRRLSACRPIKQTAWRAKPAQRVPFEFRGAEVIGNADTAKTAALAAATREAKTYCAQSATVRVTSTRFEQMTWKHCDQGSREVPCDFSATLVCEREFLEETEHLSCRP